MEPANVRSTTILWITDEVQTGLGRTGDHFWGRQAHAEAGPPDLLTFDKGIGNGMSIGGVVARAAVMNCLDTNFTSTFGGSPVTMAAGLANLMDFLEHDIQGNARRVGGLLIERLRAVAAGCPSYGKSRSGGGWGGRRNPYRPPGGGLVGSVTDERDVGVLAGEGRVVAPATPGSRG